MLKHNCRLLPSFSDIIAICLPFEADRLTFTHAIQAAFFGDKLVFDCTKSDRFFGGFGFNHGMIQQLIRLLISIFKIWLFSLYWIQHVYFFQSITQWISIRNSGGGYNTFSWSGVDMLDVWKSSAKISMEIFGWYIGCLLPDGSSQARLNLHHHVNGSHLFGPHCPKTKRIKAIFWQMFNSCVGEYADYLI